ncbi:MAG: RIP metalloprotease RseP [Proteobacteria bacterium]|nr:RIP metalloprotease RseP [Pseudomonadota bacterium]
MNLILQIIQPLVIFAVVISIIVFFHELGHFSLARLFGVRVEEFSIGFGKPIFTWLSSKGTRWRIGWLPLGGYVRMFGDADPASFPDEKKLQDMTTEDLQQAFYRKPLWQKALIVFAGPAFSYILAIIIFTGLLWVYGQVVFSNTIAEVVPNSPAQVSGMQKDDKVLSLNGAQVESLNDVRMMLTANTGEEIELVVERDSTQYTIHVTPQMQEIADGNSRKIRVAVLGIKAGQYTIKSYTLPQSFVLACKQSYQMSALILKSIPQFFTGQRSTKELGGPLTIADTSNRSYTDAGIGGLFMFIAMLSLNLGLLNILPIPMLDGGHLMFYAIEAVRGRPVAISVMAIAARVGMILLLGLMLFVISNDIMLYVFG